MKISIGTNIVKGSWGGGNQFALNLTKFLKKRGWEVTYDLKEKDIDIILMTEPRRTSESGKYNQLQISKYIFQKPNTIVVHRINECDERKQTKNINKYLMRANKVADFTVFISNFLRNLFINKNFFKGGNSFYIRNGADKNVFNKKNKKKWNEKTSIRIVTHHWSSNYYKGFDIYKKLDGIKILNKRKIEFSYIGRISNNIQFKNTKIIPPLQSTKLAEKLKSNHIYITASINEPAGMHHIEGAMCGLPILFRNSGALPEYCSSFGVMFNGLNDFKEKLAEIIREYEFFYNKLSKYPYDSELMCKKYEELFIKLLKTRKELNLFYRRIKYFKIFLKEIFFLILEILLLKIKKLNKLIIKKKHLSINES